MKFKKIFRGNLSEFFLIILGGILAVSSGHLLFNQYWFPGILSFLSFVIISFILSRRKQDKIIIKPALTPSPLASDYPEGTIVMKYKE